MVKPKIVISRCLNIEPVRYNGGIVNDEFSKKLLNYVDYITVCPEVDIGMPVPRPSVILYKKENKIRMIEPNSKKDYTDEILDFSYRFLENLKDIDGFLLKSKSPSCGVKDTKLYQENLKGLINGKSNGLFAQATIDKSPHLPVEDEGRLNDYFIRRDFLTKIFTFARFRNLKESIKNIEDLIEFHKKHKYLIMLYSSNSLKKLGNIVANWKSIGLENTLAKYEKEFYIAFSKKTNINKHVNVIQHIYGHFNNKLNEGEKKHILKMIDKFANNKIQLETLIEYIKSFIYRFNDKYLKEQYFLEPFPEELIH